MPLLTKKPPLLNKSYFTLLFIFLVFFIPLSIRAQESSLFHFFKNRDKDIIPVPVFETRPDEGQSYGLMPVLLLSDKEDKSLKAMIGLIGQYNTITKGGGAALAYFYPEADQEIEIFAGLSQKFYREVTLGYFNPTLSDHYFIDFDFTYIKSPFGRFFGLGPTTVEGDQSNFTSNQILVDAIFGYYFLKNIRVEWVEKFHTVDLQGRAITDIDDTLTRYGNLPQVVDATNLIHGANVVFDNRKEREYATSGTIASLGSFFANKALGSDQNFEGWQLEIRHLNPTLADRLTTALRFSFQQMYGDNIPFYEMSSLGGPNELRSFVPLRFVDKGKMTFQIEERIQLIKWELFGIPFEIHTDPFFEVGRVFDSVKHLGFKDWQPVGGLGFRLFVPPNVVGRLDMAIGSEGLEIYTELGYPF